MRSLRVDSFRASRIALLLAILLMTALLAWFFLARVTLYEVGNSLQWLENGMLQAAFPDEAQGRLRAGQLATVRLNAGPDQPPLSIPAMVYDVPLEGGQVQLYLLTNELPGGSPQAKLNGQVEVAVERITPAELVLRTSGKYLNRSPNLTAPQNPQD